MVVEIVADINILSMNFVDESVQNLETPLVELTKLAIIFALNNSNLEKVTV